MASILYWKNLEIIVTIIYPTGSIIHHLRKVVDETSSQTTCEHELKTSE